MNRSKVWPKLNPNKPERLKVICPSCYRRLPVGRWGAVPTCPCAQKEKK